MRTSPEISSGSHGSIEFFGKIGKPGSHIKTEKRRIGCILVDSGDLDKTDSPPLVRDRDPTLGRDGRWTRAHGEKGSKSEYRPKKM